MLLVTRARAPFPSAEFGFLGVEVKTRTHTPRFWGDPWSAGLSVFDLSFSRPIRTSWLTVGNRPPRSKRGPCRGTVFNATFRVYARAESAVKGLKQRALGYVPGVPGRLRRWRARWPRWPPAGGRRPSRPACARRG